MLFNFKTEQEQSISVLGTTNLAICLSLLTVALSARVQILLLLLHLYMQNLK